MKSKIFLLLFYILFIFNSNLFSAEDNKTLKVGLLAPLSGPYSEIGNSLLYSLQLALEEINDKNVIIVPRDSGFNNEKKIKRYVQLKYNINKNFISCIHKKQKTQNIFK